VLYDGCEYGKEKYSRIADPPPGAPWPLQGVEENYLDVTKNNLLIVSEVRAGVTVDTLPSGSPNVVQALYQPMEMSDTYVAPVVRSPIATRAPSDSLRAHGTSTAGWPRVSPGTGPR